MLISILWTCYHGKQPNNSKALFSVAEIYKQKMSSVANISGWRHSPWYSLQFLTLFTPIWSWLSISVPNVSLACLMRSRWHEREEVRENSWWYFHRESFVKCEVSFLISIESQSLKTLQEGRVDLIHAFAQKCFFFLNSMQDSS